MYFVFQNKKNKDLNEGTYNFRPFSNSIFNWSYVYAGKNQKDFGNVTKVK